MKKLFINIALVIALIVPCLLCVTGCSDTPPAPPEAPNLALGNYVLKTSYCEINDNKMQDYSHYHIVTIKENNLADYTGRAGGSFTSFNDIKYSLDGRKISVEFGGENYTGLILDETTFQLEYVNVNYSTFYIFEHEEDITIENNEYIGTTDTGLIINTNITSKTTTTLTIKTSADDTTPTVLNSSLKILGNRVIIESDSVIYLGCYHPIKSTDSTFYLTNLYQYTKATNTFTLIDAEIEFIEV